MPLRAALGGTPYAAKRNAGPGISPRSIRAICCGRSLVITKTPAGSFHGNRASTIDQRVGWAPLAWRADLQLRLAANHPNEL